MGRDAIAFEVEDSDRLREPGAYTFLHCDDKRVGIVHACPCGCGRHSTMAFKGLGWDGHDEWAVTGEWPNVTCTPSIGIGRGQGPNGSYHWHGYLEAGIFVER